MPDEIDDYILQRLRFQLEMEGVEDVAAALKEIASANKDVIGDYNKLHATFGSLDNAAQSLVKTYKDKTAEGVKGAKKERAEVLKLRQAVSLLEGSLGTLSKVGAGIVLRLGGQPSRACGNQPQLP